MTQPEIAILLLTIAVAAALVFLRRLVFIGTVRALRFIMRPLNRLFRYLTRQISRVLRFFGLAPKPRPGKPVQALTGLAVDAVARLQTETEQEIAAGFDTNSIAIKRHNRFFCTWLEPNVYRREYDRAQAELDFKKAKEFFKAEVDMASNPLNLYDDINNAFIVKLFKDSDKTCFHVLAEFRKTIALNVVIISVIFSLIVSVVAVVNILISNSFDFYRYFELDTNSHFPATFNILDWTFETALTINKFLFGILSCLAGFLLMLFFYHISYEQFQRLNGQQINNFLLGYLDEVSINFAKI